MTSAPPDLAKLRALAENMPDANPSLSIDIENITGLVEAVLDHTAEVFPDAMKGPSRFGDNVSIILAHFIRENELLTIGPAILKLLDQIEGLTKERDAARKEARTPGTVEVCGKGLHVGYASEHTCTAKPGSVMAMSCSEEGCPIREAIRQRGRT